jgi:hypothetical protein
MKRSEENVFLIDILLDFLSEILVLFWFYVLMKLNLLYSPLFFHLILKCIVLCL